MKWRTKLFGVVYDIFLGAYSGLAIFWSVLIVGVATGAPGLFLVLFPALFFISLLSIFVHELGHLIAALATGLRVTLFASWPLMVVQTGRGFQLRHFNLPSPMLGLVAAFPRNVRHLAWKRGLYLCGGPMFSLLAAIGSLTLAYAVQESEFNLGSRGPIPFWNRLMIPRNGTSALFFIISAVNLFFLVASLRPVPFKKFYTDGAAFLAMIWDRRLVVQTWLVEALSNLSLNGVRPRELNEEFIQHLSVTRNGSAQDVSANFFGFYDFLDRGETDRAGELIDLLAANREKFDSRHQSYALLEAAYFEARHRHNAFAARRWLDQASKDGVEPQSYLRAEAATLLAEGRCKEAAIIAKAALIALPSSADKGGAIAEKEWLESILAESESKLSG
jgi:hypothetical protein